MVHTIDLVVISPTAGMAESFLAALPAEDSARARRPSDGALTMHYARLRVDDDLVVDLYAVPAELQDATMWPLLLTFKLGIMCVVDGRSPQAVSEARTLLHMLLDESPLPCVVAVTHSEGAALTQIDETLNIPTRHRIAACDVGESEQATAALRDLLLLLIEEMEDQP